MKVGCIRNHKLSGEDRWLVNANVIQADMASTCNQKTGTRWLQQNAYNMAIRRELRRRGLPVALVTGVPLARQK
jgi:hypothetical protein